ncbi:trypsin-like peptidase domain-containing protein [Candidatus Nomurabacteria bacterium]|nr:trypsin-like peptidase domain-containing protein [Candidatus Nomurabacteria bacterium]
MPILINILARAVIMIFAYGLTFLGLIQPTLPAKQENAIVDTPRSGADFLANIIENRDTNPIEKQIEKQTAEQKSQAEVSTKKSTPDISGINVPLPVLKSFSEDSFDENFNTAAKKSKNAVVNIFCLNKEGKLLNANTGSGIIISPKGVVLTNAHIAELFLFKNYPTENFVDCTIRKFGSASYKADLLYISDKWMSQNAKIIFEDSPQGNGERDYALLLLKQNGTLPYLELNNSEYNLVKGTPVFAAGYPGNIFTNTYFEKSLTLTGDTTYINDVKTFNGMTPDTIETAETNVGQRGSSGGAITDSSGNLIALIDSVSGLGLKSRINALTVSYIMKNFQNENGISLKDFLNKDLNKESQNFVQNKVPQMIKMVIE